jgi:polar amino acid transport system substrate-binding protein
MLAEWGEMDMLEGMKRAKFLMGLLGAGLLGLMGLVGCGPSGGPKPLVVGMDLSYPPFETIDQSGKPVGVSVDLAQALADSMGRPLVIENIPFVGLIPSLQAGRLDCVISSMTVTEERKMSVSFSDPYLKTGLGVLVSAGSGLKDLEDAPTRTYVVRQGTTGEVWARKNLNQAKILAVDKENAAVLEVIQNKVDGFIYDQMSVWTNWTNHSEKTVALLKPLQVEEWAVAVKRGDVEMVDAINSFLTKFRVEGGFNTLSEKYLSKQKEAFENQGVTFVF